MLNTYKLLYKGDQCKQGSTRLGTHILPAAVPLFRYRHLVIHIKIKFTLKNVLDA